MSLLQTPEQLAADVARRQAQRRKGATTSTPAAAKPKKPLSATTKAEMFKCLVEQRLKTPLRDGTMPSRVGATAMIAERRPELHAAWLEVSNRGRHK